MAGSPERGLGPRAWVLAVEEVVGWGTRVPHAPAEVPGVVVAAAAVVEGLGAVETRPGGATGPSAGLEGGGDSRSFGGGQPPSWGLQEGRAHCSGLLEPPLLWAGVSVEREM